MIDDSVGGSFAFYLSYPTTCLYNNALWDAATVCLASLWSWVSEP
jgi:hypothetical protein